MKKKILMLILSIFLCSCSYFQVKEAMKEADRGNYVISLSDLLSILQKDSEDRRALDAFELIYPSAEKHYYDEIDISKVNDIIRYTKGLLNLLRVQEIYYKLPEISKKSIAVIEPPIQERNVIKKDLAQNFYTLGKGMRTVTYEEKLRTYGYFSQAKKYDLENRKDINSEFIKSRDTAQGRFLFNFTGKNNLAKLLEEELRGNINNYPLFSIGNSKNYNLKLDVNISNYHYLPPKTTSQSGIDSYIEKVVKRVFEKVVETKVVNGHTILVEKWVPVDKVVEVEIFYRYVRNIKRTAMEYDLAYNLYEKNGNPISQKVEKIVYEDSVVWTEYYPVHPFIGGRPFNFPMSEYEKYVMNKEELKGKVLELGNIELNRVLSNLDSNRKIDW